MDQVIYSVQAAILFLVLASPFMYNLVNSILGSIVPIAVNGCPTMAGVIVHAIVYGLLVYLLMTLQTPAPVVVPPPAVEAFANKKAY